MYITINDIKGEKRIDLSYSIDSDKEIAVIVMLSDNIQYKVLKFTSLSLRITDQNNNVITDSLQVTVVLHICDHKI